MILIVDDDHGVRKVLKKIILRQGYTVFTAENAARALEIIKKEKIKIVFTDIVMPGMDGIGLLESIKKDFPEIQVIVMTGQTSLLRTTAALQTGALTYLLKPFEEPAVINDAIEKALAKTDEWKKIIAASIKAKKK